MEITDIGAFLPYFDGIRGRTRRVVQCIPPDRVEWAHREGAFTLGDLVRHLAATERWMFAENVAGRPSRYPGHTRDLAEGFDGVLGYLDRMHAEAMEIFRTLTSDDLARPCTTPAGTPITTWKWLRAMVEHEVHHRGQIYLMLGMLGVPTPPLYGLTSEEVKERSLPFEEAPTRLA
ncbi:MAG TPA: DinB family protein [Longimicrobiaceae bacterium]|nr:DinB family protein [Longimicrobiaceae bacterium]